MGQSADHCRRASLFPYLPQQRNGGDSRHKPLGLCWALKNGDRKAASWVVARVLRLAQSPPLNGIFAADSVLVPVPSHAPHRKGSVWSTRALTRWMVARGLGGSDKTVLKWWTVVTRSATAASDQRPTAVNHLQSTCLSSPLVPPHRIVLVDDAVTTGATILAGVSAISGAMADLRVCGLAFSRTVPSGGIGLPMEAIWETARLQPDGRTVRRA